MPFNEMKSQRLSVIQKLCRILRPGVRGSTHQHDPLLLDSLAAFNFRPPIIELPGEQLARRGAVAR